MNRYAFRIDYKSDPLRSGNNPVSGDDVSGALCRFRDALPLYMAELNAFAKASEPIQGREYAIRVNVYTHLDWAKASVAMAAFAGRHGLRAVHVANALVPSAEALFREHSIA